MVTIKNAKYAHYVRQTLKHAKDLNAAVERLYLEHESKAARDLVTDIYILEAERRAGTHSQQRKAHSYNLSYSKPGRDKKTQLMVVYKMIEYEHYTQATADTLLTARYIKSKH